jgi:DUF4097 and DUF4098 domain-containing protein YvlB
MRQHTRGFAFALLLAVGVASPLLAEHSRAVHQAFPAGAAELRLANLAGRVELVPGSGAQVVIEATVHAEAGNAAETQRLLDGMKWVRSHDRKGREEWALAYPVEKYRAFHYPGFNSGAQPSFFSFLDNSSTATLYRGERVRVYSHKRSSAPTLYADLRVALPAGSNVVVRNVVGAVRAGAPLAGKLGVDTGSGKVEIADYSGNLNVGTGSGDVVVGAVKGETKIDTGSGDVVVRRLVGNGLVNTGSGDVTVEKVAAGKLAVDTGSGDVVVKDGTAARLVADTGSGDVHVLGVEIEELDADTGSGNVVVRSSLANTRRVTAETGSGDIHITAGRDASFDVDSDQGSGDLKVDYADAVLRRSGRKVVGARRGAGKTAIHVQTGSGDCVISPRAES